MKKWVVFFAGQVFFFQAAFAACPVEADIKPNCCVGPTLCTSNPLKEKDCDYGYWIAEVGFLWEQVRLTGSQFGYSQLIEIVPPAVVVTETLLRPSFDLDWGVTAGLGWYLLEDQWMIKACFDWLESTAKKNRDDGAFVPANIVDNISGGAFPLGRANAFQTRLRIDYYMLDVMLFRGSYVSGCVALDPHAGVKTAWFYYRGNYNFEQTAEELLLQRDLHTNSWGVGPEVGLDLDWNLVSGCFLYAESGLALLFGNTKPRNTDNFDRGTTDILIIGKESRDDCIPSARITLGLRFNMCFCEDSLVGYVKVAFDSVFYWNQFDQINNFLSANQGGGCSKRL